MWTWCGDASIFCAECELTFRTWRPGEIVGVLLNGFVPWRTWLTVHASPVAWYAGAIAEVSPFEDAVLQLLYTPRTRITMLDPAIVETPNEMLVLEPTFLGMVTEGQIVAVEPISILTPPPMLVLEPVMVAFDEIFVIACATPYWSAYVGADAASLAGSAAKAILTARRTDSAHAEATSVRDQASIGVTASPVRTARIPVHAWPRGGWGREFMIVSCPTIFSRWVQASCTSRGAYASADVAVRTCERKSLPVRGMVRNDLIVAPTSGWVRNRSEATAEVTAEVCGLFG